MSPRRREDLVRRVDDAELPAAESAPKGYYVAVVGDPADGQVPVFDFALGYCVWGDGASGVPSFAWLYLTGIEGSTGNTVLVADENGDPILAYSPTS
jgi:hypothetical protein